MPLYAETRDPDAHRASHERSRREVSELRVSFGLLGCWGEMANPESDGDALFQKGKEALSAPDVPLAKKYFHDAAEVFLFLSEHARASPAFAGRCHRADTVGQQLSVV